ncbi:MAG: hypothetical protein ABIR96_04590, partial [Bdellovibrionota bacterium]
MKNSRQRNILAYNFFSTLCWSVIVASPLVARAADNKPITSKDWTYSKRAVGSEILCFAETQKKVGDLTWTFSVVADPSKATATAIYVGSGAGDIGSKLDLQTDSSRTLYTHLRSSSDDVRIASTAYWFAPNKLSSFYQQLRRDSTIKLAYIDAEAKEQKLYFSLSGSMAALDNLETLCDSKKEVVWLAFFDGLDRQVAAQGTGLRGVDNLKTTLNDAWATYFVTGVHQSAANALDGQMRPYIEQEKAFLARSGKLNGQLGVKNAEKSQVESKKAAFVSTRARLAEELDRTEQSLSGALATLKTKEDIYRPAAEEVKPAIEAFNAASAEVNNYAARISEQENRVDSATSRISQLDRESRQKQSDIDAYERELNDLQTRRARAQSDLNSFNYDWELRRAMDSDSRYRWTFEEIRRNQSNIDQLSRDYHRAEEDNRDAERDLRQCQGGRLGVASLAMENAVMARGPGGGGSEGPRPGGGGNGPHPGNGGDNGGGGHGPHPPGGGGGNGGGGNTPPPRPNCSSQEARARQTRDDLNTISSRLSNEQQSLD